MVLGTAKSNTVQTPKLLGTGSGYNFIGRLLHSEITAKLYENCLNKREIYNKNYENRLLTRFLSTTCHPKCMTGINSFSHHKITKQTHYCPHVTDEETKQTRSNLTCPESHVAHQWRNQDLKHISGNVTQAGPVRILPWSLTLATKGRNPFSTLGIHRRDVARQLLVTEIPALGRKQRCKEHRYRRRGWSWRSLSPQTQSLKSAFLAFGFKSQGSLEGAFPSRLKIHGKERLKGWP